jgi:hypothetical protein
MSSSYSNSFPGGQRFPSFFVPSQTTTFGYDPRQQEYAGGLGVNTIDLIMSLFGGGNLVSSDDSDGFPAMEDVKQLRKQLLSLKASIDGWDSLVTRLKQRTNDLPERISGEHNLGAIVMHSERISKEVKNIAGGKDLSILLALTKRICERDSKPPSLEVWSKFWMEQKLLVDEEASDDDGLDGVCRICSTNKTNVQIQGCKCSSNNGCASCILKHYYTSSENGAKSSSTCPFCRAEFTLDKIVPTKEGYISSRIKTFSSGKVLRGEGRSCSVCKEKKADSRMTCCPNAAVYDKCAECFFGDLYDKEYVTKQTTCEHCEKTHNGFEVCRPFAWANTANKRQKTN